MCITEGMYVCLHTCTYGYVSLKKQFCYCVTNVSPECLSLDKGIANLNKATETFLKSIPVCSYKAFHILCVNVKIVLDIY